MTPEEFVDAVTLAINQPKADPVLVVETITKALADVTVPVSVPLPPPAPPVVVPPGPDPVETLLRESMTAHRLYLQARLTNDPAAKEWLAKAYQLRQDANELDPEHEAEQWQTEKQITEKTYSESINMDLLAFYHQMGAAR